MPIVTSIAPHGYLEDSVKAAPNYARTGSSELSTAKRIAISVFVCFHVIVIACWSIPLNTLIFKAVNDKTAPYTVWAGLFQTWGLFAPDPLNINLRINAEITYRDGRTTIWQFPLPQDFGYIRRSFESRMEATSHAVRDDKNSVLWPDAARYVARLNNHADNPPITVKLVSNWSPLSPPGSNQPQPWNQHLFFTYSVTPGDLQ